MSHSVSVGHWAVRVLSMQKIYDLYDHECVSAEFCVIIVRLIGFIVQKIAILAASQRVANSTHEYGRIIHVFFSFLLGEEF